MGGPFEGVITGSGLMYTTIDTPRRPDQHAQRRAPRRGDRPRTRAQRT